MNGLSAKRAPKSTGDAVITQNSHVPKYSDMTKEKDHPRIWRMVKFCFKN